jgi:hypothetical protein
LLRECPGQHGLAGRVTHPCTAPVDDSAEPTVADEDVAGQQLDVTLARIDEEVTRLRMSFAALATDAWASMVILDSE